MSVLVVLPSPIDRPSTPGLQILLQTLCGRAGVEVTIWYLREDWFGLPRAELQSCGGPPWVVDHLRTSPPVRLLELAGLRQIAAGVRGRLLRRRLRQVAPDVALLDDGYGSRVLETYGAPLVRVGRRNLDPSPAAGIEQEPEDGFDLWLTEAGAPVPTTTAPVRRVSPFLGDFGEARDRWSATRVEEVRRSLGIDPGSLLVVGWGGTSWLDGPELFIRTLWALEARHGIRAHGLWAAEDATAEDRARLEGEAVRCSVAERYHLVDGTVDLHGIGDVALLPYRCPGDAHVLEVLASGCAVVAFAAVGWGDEGVTVVPDLDTDAAAAAVAAVDRRDRPVRVEAARRALDPEGLVDDLLALVRRR